MLFRSSKKTYSIQRVDQYQNENSITALIERVKYLELQIAEVNKAILEAQVVRIRSLFSKEKNFLIGIQKRMVESNVERSMKWHLYRLSELKKEQRDVQYKIDLFTGQIWPKRMAGLIRLLLYMISTLIVLAILIMGIFAAIYLIPIIGIIIFTFIIFNRLSNRVK